jgi:hypothetical protein
VGLEKSGLGEGRESRVGGVWWGGRKPDCLIDNEATRAQLDMCI